ncbi:MAG: hypothetical protein WCL28_06455 [bacterium]
MRDEKSRSDLGMYFKVHLFSMILLSLITGCGKTKKSKPPTSNDTNTSTQVADGNWLGSCEADGAGKSKKSDFVVSGSSATSTIRTFSDANCVTEASVSVFSIRFVVGRPVATPAGAFEVEQTVSKIMMTLKTPEGVTMANEGVKIDDAVVWPATCNGGFTINVPKELNSTVCAGDLLYGALFSTSYGIVKVDGDKIYFGETDETNDGSTPAKRPTKLESSHYSKQPSGGEISLTGTWVGACEQDEDGSSSQSTLTFSGSSLTSTSGSYLDADCTQEEFVYVETGSFTLGNELSSPAGAFTYDLKIDQIIVTYKTDERVTAVNADGGLCGQTVTKDVGLELDAADCSGDPVFSSFFSTAYDVVKVDGDKLSFGELTTTNDGSTAEKRPTALSTSYSVKQP